MGCVSKLIQELVWLVQLHSCTPVKVYRCTGQQVCTCTGVQVYTCTNGLSLDAPHMIWRT